MGPYRFVAVKPGYPKPVKQGQQGSEALLKRKAAVATQWQLRLQAGWSVKRIAFS